MQTWQDLLLAETWEDVSDEYGPHSQAVASAFSVFDETPWLEQAGDVLVSSASIIAVPSWDEAITPLTRDDDTIYGPNGHLLAPSERCIEVIESEQWQSVWEEARAEAAEFCNFTPYIPTHLSDEYQDFIYEYLYEFVSFLLAEIMAPEMVKMTYFREMLAWFYAGHFPCGWEGTWPNGEMRIY